MPRSDAEKSREYNRRWRLSEKGRLWIENRRELTRAENRSAYARHREKRKASAALRRKKYKDEAFASYGGYVCICCGTTEQVFLVLDHIAGGGHKHRQKVGAGNAFYTYLRRMKFPPGFQVLCQNCNWAKHVLGALPLPLVIEDGCVKLNEECFLAA